MRSPWRWRLLVAAILLPLTPPSPTPAGAERHARSVAGDQVVEDPGFEDPSVPPCFRGTGGAEVRRTGEEPLTGTYSLDVSLPGGSAATCRRSWSSPLVGTRLTGGIEVANPRRREVSVCLSAVVVGSASALRDCTPVGMTPLRRVTLALPLGGRDVVSVAWRVTPGPRAATARLDEARLTLATSAPCSAAPAGPPVPGSPCDQNVVPGDSGYEPATLHLRDQRPYLQLDDYTVAPVGDPVAVRFRKYVDRALAGSPDYGYTPADAVILHARTGARKYLGSAIDEVDAKVRAAERAIADGDPPLIASDSYLEVGPLLEELALAYDWGHHLLTRAQRFRWMRYGDQAVSNVWSPDTATWGDEPAGAFAWSGWSINNPGNNYNFSFLQATELWAIATRHRGWMEFLQDRKFPLLEDYYAQIVGGGSREGTGYGTAQARLWANARIWAAATGEHLGAVERHARESVDYWVNATVPTLDLFAPIGDLSRESFPNLYDYQENLVREAALAAPGTPQADHALWWIAHNSVPDTMSNSFNLRGALLRPDGSATQPTALTYAAPGVGQFFARTSRGTDATWLSVVAGPYDESHAHMEQGSFNLYDEQWLAVTANVWSHSGLQGNSDGEGDLGTGAGSMLRFDTADGAVPQNNGTSAMTTSTAAGTVLVDADLGAAYSSSAELVSGWTRHLALTDSRLEVRDSCTVADGVTPVWQLQVPDRPTPGPPGRVRAGDLRLSFDPSYAVRVVDLGTINEDLLDGWRIELTREAGCGFAVDLDVVPD